MKNSVSKWGVIFALITKLAFASCVLVAFQALPKAYAAENAGEFTQRNEAPKNELWVTFRMFCFVRRQSAELHLQIINAEYYDQLPSHFSKENTDSIAAKKEKLLRLYGHLVALRDTLSRALKEDGRTIGLSGDKVTLIKEAVDMSEALKEGGKIEGVNLLEHSRK